MPAVSLCNVIELQAPPYHRFVPALPPNTVFTALLIDIDRMKAVVATNDTDMTGAGIRQLISGPTWAELGALSRRSQPNNPTRNVINSWLSDAGFLTLPANVTTWRDVIHFVVRQVSFNLDLDTISINRSN